MGEEISKLLSESGDLARFRKSVVKETKILEQWLKENTLEVNDQHFGYELEGCLVDLDYRPAMKNEEFLSRIHDSQVVPELAKFNLEINGDVYSYNPNCFSQMQSDIESLERKVRKTTNEMQLHPLWIGILPTLRDDDLNLNTMTPRNRYFALAKKMMELRQGKPVHLELSRKDEMILLRDNIMTEAATTSLQVHHQVKPKDAVRAYNISLNLSAPCTALFANSPFLYGKKLWDESRIPVFEQSLQLPDSTRGAGLQPVTFGDGYIKKSILECFEENLSKHQVILPVEFDDIPEKLRHLKFLNGQVWRWVRPIIGTNNKEEPHIRLEQRSFSAGPSCIDTVANTAFYTGLLFYYLKSDENFEKSIPFHLAIKNFYKCAQFGLKADIHWVNGTTNVQTLLHDILLPQAEIGLQYLGISQKEINYYIQHIIKTRIRTGWNGAAWQKSFIDTHGSDFQEMTKQYIENQKSGTAVIDWKV